MFKGKLASQSNLKIYFWWERMVPLHRRVPRQPPLHAARWIGSWAERVWSDAVTSSITALGRVLGVLASAREWSELWRGVEMSCPAVSRVWLQRKFRVLWKFKQVVQFKVLEWATGILSTDAVRVRVPSLNCPLRICKGVPHWTYRY